MKKLPFCFSLLAVLFACEPAVDTHALAASSSNSSSAHPALGAVTGFVRDPGGRPLAGAVISLLREGADEIVRQTKSTADGTFSVRVAPGRYILQATLAGFEEARFSSVNVAASDELVYRFNLQRAGEGRTTAEQRPDRDEAKFRVRAANSRRSIFQADESADGETVALAREAADRVETREQSAGGEQVLIGGIVADTQQEAADAAKNDQAQPLRGAVQTYFASAAADAPFLGFNFALAQRLNERLRFVIVGQAGAGSVSDRLDLHTRIQLNDRHTLRARFGAARLGAARTKTLHGNTLSEDAKNTLSQISAQALDEWTVRDGVVVVLGFDYARFLSGGGRSRTFAPRLGVQFDANASTRLRAAYAPGERRNTAGEFGRIEFEDGDVIIEDAVEAAQATQMSTGEVLIERSRRLEFGVERILDNRSRIEATGFFDTTDDRGIGLLRLPASGFRGRDEAEFTHFAEQEGGARGVRVVYARRLNGRTNFSAGYSFGRGQELAADAGTNLEEQAPGSIFRNAYFHTGAAQVDADFETGTQVQAVVRFSSQATVFAVDPFAGQLAVYDPSLSILVTQELPSFGLPVRLKAIVDARNLLDMGAVSEDADSSVLVSAMRRSVRGGIAVRF